MKNTIIIVFMFLNACANAPSFKKNPAEMASVLNSKEACCTSLDQIEYKKIEKLPFKTSNWAFSHWEILGDQSQVYVFDGYKGYILAYELPDLERPYSFSFVSWPTTSWVSTAGVFSPIFKILDANFNIIDSHADFRSGKGNIAGEFRLPRNSKYFIIHTNQEKLKGAVCFRHTTSAGLTVISTDECYPHLPEGAFDLYIE